MAKVKKNDKEVVQSASGTKVIRSTCNHCRNTGQVIFYKTPIEAGGSKCRGCGKFDNFYANYELSGEKLAMITIVTSDGMKCRTVAKGDDAEKLQEFFKLQPNLLYWEVENILIEAGLAHEEHTKFVSRFVTDIEQQEKHEKFIAKKLKAYLKK